MDGRWSGWITAIIAAVALVVLGTAGLVVYRNRAECESRGGVLAQGIFRLECVQKRTQPKLDPVGRTRLEYSPTHPKGNCSPSRDLWMDTTNMRLYICAEENAWVVVEDRHDRK